jgi:hypothetical protein
MRQTQLQFSKPGEKRMKSTRMIIAAGILLAYVIPPGANAQQSKSTTGARIFNTVKL